MTVILPIALSAGVLIFLFMFINSRSGGGANAKMMNFGRSRARMSIDQQGQLYQMLPVWKRRKRNWRRS